MEAVIDYVIVLIKEKTCIKLITGKVTYVHCQDSCRSMDNLRLDEKIKELGNEGE